MKKKEDKVEEVVKNDEDTVKKENKKKVAKKTADKEEKVKENDNIKKEEAKKDTKQGQKETKEDIKDEKKDRACLNYHIKKCLAPCMGYVTVEAYKKQIDQIIMLLEGKIDNIKRELKKDMENYSQNMEYEKAAEVRDRISAIERVVEKQKVSNISENNIDVIGLYKNEVSCVVEIFFVRGSKMIGREHYFFEDLVDESNKEILSDFIKQYYLNSLVVPHRILERDYRI